MATIGEITQSIFDDYSPDDDISLPESFDASNDFENIEQASGARTNMYSAADVTGKGHIAEGIHDHSIVAPDGALPLSSQDPVESSIIKQAFSYMSPYAGPLISIDINTHSPISFTNNASLESFTSFGQTSISSVFFDQGLAALAAPGERQAADFGSNLSYNDGLEILTLPSVAIAASVGTDTSDGRNAFETSAADVVEVEPLSIGPGAALTSELTSLSGPLSVGSGLTFALHNIGGVTPGSQAEAGFLRAAALWSGYLAACRT
jgi:hypothetical protein